MKLLPAWARLHASAQKCTPILAASFLSQDLHSTPPFSAGLWAQAGAPCLRHHPAFLPGTQPAGSSSRSESRRTVVRFLLRGVRWGHIPSSSYEPCDYSSHQAAALPRLRLFFLPWSCSFSSSPICLRQERASSQSCSMPGAELIVMSVCVCVRAYVWGGYRQAIYTFSCVYTCT